ncbi:MAG: TlyA family RNA methyltransferase [Proteobacteria bacterium]|nr:TlyA family RNA methyltransferase [Pseudomonadota bacterium]MBU1688848.1 TlyA family RNA methyltransferase [Pseudomonadota bacterium]
MKYRLDQLLLVRNLAPTRHKAQGLIAAAQVVVNGHTVDKAGTRFAEECVIEIKGDNCPYVSRGGLKIEAGLNHFGINPMGLICADLGASTGGFTDCLLQRGAVRVYAVDVGYGQLAWKLRQDPRVVVMERTNARYLTREAIPEELDMAVIDASFISLELLLAPIKDLLKAGGIVLALIKPQFEVGRGQVGKGGVVRDQSLKEEAIRKIERFAVTLGFQSFGTIPSPILGPKGNQEFLLSLGLP